MFWPIMMRRSSMENASTGFLRSLWQVTTRCDSNSGSPQRTPSSSSSVEPRIALFLCGRIGRSWGLFDFAGRAALAAAAFFSRRALQLFEYLFEVSQRPFATRKKYVLYPILVRWQSLAASQLGGK